MVNYKSNKNTVASPQIFSSMNLLFHAVLAIQAYIVVHIVHAEPQQMNNSNHVVNVSNQMAPSELDIGNNRNHMVNVSAKAGTDLRLECNTVMDQGGTCQWTVDGFGLGPAASGWPRYSMEDCNLHLDPVLAEDEGVYVCQVGGGGTSPRVGVPVSVKVVSEPGTPHIHQAKEEDVVIVKEGKEVVLTCESGGGNPQAEIMWTATHVKDNRENVDIDVTHVINRVEPSKDGKSFKTLSTLKFVPKKSVDITCSAFSEQFRHPKTSRPLEIRLKSKPSVEIEFDKVDIVEGDRVKIKCADTNLQEDLIYNWFVNDLEMEGVRDNVLELNGVSRRQNNAQIKCVASNSVGKDVVTRTLQVKYSPAIISQPLSQNVGLGQNVELSCEAEGNPTPKYIWIRQPSGKLVGEGAKLAFVASEETEGQYLCKAYSDGFKSTLSPPATVSVKRKPKIFAEQISYSHIAEDVVLKCRVHSSSEHTKVLWTKNEDPIEANSSKYQLVQEHRKTNLIESYLSILKLSSDDFGEFGCFASNEIGSDYINMSVKKKEGGGYGAIILLVNIAVGSMVVLTLLIVYRHRKLRRESKLLKRGVVHPIYRTTVIPLNKNEDGGLLDKLLLENSKDINENNCKVNMALNSSFG